MKKSDLIGKSFTKTTHYGGNDTAFGPLGPQKQEVKTILVKKPKWTIFGKLKSGTGQDSIVGIIEDSNQITAIVNKIKSQFGTTTGFERELVKASAEVILNQLATTPDEDMLLKDGESLINDLKEVIKKQEEIIKHFTWQLSLIGLIANSGVDDGLIREEIKCACRENDAYCTSYKDGDTPEEAWQGELDAINDSQ